MKISMHIFYNSLLQMNYLIDEANATGKVPITVISLLHHFFETHGMGELYST